jgi:GntR family transcriptional regulator
MSRPAAKLVIPPISPTAAGPLYQQIVDGVRREVSEGRLPPGAPVPSIRGFAADLQVSVITVMRAYEELERDGIIFRRQGLGTFVTESADDLTRQAKSERARELLREAVREGTEAGLSEDELQREFRKLFRTRGVAAHVGTRD